MKNPTLNKVTKKENKQKNNDLVDDFLSNWDNCVFIRAYFMLEYLKSKVIQPFGKCSCFFHTRGFPRICFPWNSYFQQSYCFLKILYLKSCWLLKIKISAENFVVVSCICLTHKWYSLKMQSLLFSKGLTLTIELLATKKTSLFVFRIIFLI